MNNQTINTVPSAAKTSLFSRKIGNTTYRVSVSFSEKSSEGIEDKILRLVANESRQGEILKCN